MRYIIGILTLVGFVIYMIGEHKQSFLYCLMLFILVGIGCGIYLFRKYKRMRASRRELESMQQGQEGRIRSADLTSKTVINSTGAYIPEVSLKRGYTTDIEENLGDLNDRSDYQDYSKEWKSGIGDISLPNTPVEGLSLSNIPYVSFKDSPFNRYLMEGQNKEFFLEKVSQLVDLVKREVGTLCDVSYSSMEFKPRVIDVVSRVPWFGSAHTRLNNEFCWLKDTRFTPTGRISKNAYVLNFSDTPVTLRPSTDKTTRISFGTIYLTAEHKINKGRLIQWKGSNSLIVGIKDVDGSLVINYVEEDGHNKLNT